MVKTMIKLFKKIYNLRFKGLEQYLQIINEEEEIGNILISEKKEYKNILKNEFYNYRSKNKDDGYELVKNSKKKTQIKSES